MTTLKRLEEMLSHGEISRREFLARVSALGLTAALSPALFTTPAVAAKPKKGGRLRMGMGGASTTDTLDPALIYDVMAPVLSIGQLRNCLVEIHPNGQAIPELAESWEPTPDAAVWTFRLRKGVEFHNGKTMDAEDVIYSINHHRKEETKSVASGLVKPIKDVKADGKNVVVISLESGNADFPYVMCDHHLQIVPKGTTDFEKGIGTGGYILEKWEPGVRALTKHNPNYWKADHAHFDEVENLAINDVTARTNALRTGEIDVMNRCERKTAHMLGKVPGIQSVNTTGYKHVSIPMRTDKAPFDNNDIRMALKHAIDREAVLNTILRNYGELGNDHPIARLNRYHADKLPQRQYDPDKSRFYLKKAGLDKLSVKLHVADVAFEGAVDTGVIYQADAAKAGINIEVIREPNDGYWSNVWMKKHWVMSYWSGRVTEDWMFSVAYSEGANWNETFWSHDRFNKLLIDARAELDEAKRREIYIEMQQILRDEGGVVIPAFVADLHAASTKLQTPPKVAADREMDGYRLPDRWWFKS
jgi:peptide/nickel transport system substrate-binding protein